MMMVMMPDVFEKNVMHKHTHLHMGQSLGRRARTLKNLNY